MRRILSVVLVMLILSAFSASAHELVIKPAKTEAAPGEELAVELHSVHKFIVKEEVENISRIKAGLFSGGALKESALTGNEAELRIDFQVRIENGGSALIIANKDGEVWSVTNEGSIEGSRKDLEAKGLKVIRSSKNDKFAKAIVNASGDDKNFSAAVGQELEIIPVTNPADAKAGEYFSVKILRGGQPASMPVWATYDGFAPELDNTYAYYTESGSDGVAKIKITAPGFWLVRAAKNGEPGVAGEYDTRNIISVLSFAVSAK